MAETKPEAKPEVKIEVSKPEIRWLYRAGQDTIKFTNVTGGRIAFKIKVSDADIYSVVPVYGLLDDKQSQNVTVLRADAPQKDDSVVVVFCEATADDTDPKEVFKKPDMKTQHKTIKMREKK